MKTARQTKQDRERKQQDRDAAALRDLTKGPGGFKGSRQLHNLPTMTQREEPRQMNSQQFYAQMDNRVPRSDSRTRKTLEDGFNEYYKRNRRKK